MSNPDSCANTIANGFAHAIKKYGSIGAGYYIVFQLLDIIKAYLDIGVMP